MSNENTSVQSGNSSYNAAAKLEQAAALYKLLEHTPEKSFAVLYVDQDGKVVNSEKINITSYSESAIRDIFTLALKAGATNVILGHNKPTGDIKPTREDWDFTAKLVTSALTVGLSVEDHIIVGVTADKFLSMRREMNAQEDYLADRVMDLIQSLSPEKKARFREIATQYGLDADQYLSPEQPAQDLLTGLSFQTSGKKPFQA